MPWSKKTVKRWEANTFVLRKNVVSWAKRADLIPEQWGGPSLYFHKVLVDEARKEPDPIRRLSSDTYLERLYACLMSWGMHRFDNKNARMVGFDSFKGAVESTSAKLTAISQYRLDSLTDVDRERIVNVLGEQVDDIQVVITKWPFVANAKLLHHILPDLVPPMDRRYTLGFFIGRENDSGNPPSYAFKAFFRSFCETARHNSAELQTLVSNVWSMDNKTKWNTSIPKILDNAVTTAMKLSEKTGGTL